MRLKKRRFLKKRGCRNFFIEQNATFVTKLSHYNKISLCNLAAHLKFSGVCMHIHG